MRKAKTGSMFDSLIEEVGVELVKGAKAYVQRAVERFLAVPPSPKKPKKELPPAVVDTEEQGDVFVPVDKKEVEVDDYAEPSP